MNKNRDPNLTFTEKKLLQLLSQGLTKEEVAQQLKVSKHTADGYLRKVFEKLDVHSTVAAVSESMRNGEIK